MIIKGKLKKISTGWRDSRETVHKYEYVEIGDYILKKIRIDSYLRDRLDEHMGEEIQISVFKRTFFLPKTLATMKTSDGRVYVDETTYKWINGFKGIFWISFLSFAYGIFVLYLFSMAYDGSLPFVIAIHALVSIFIISKARKAFNIFGKERTGLNHV